MTLKEKCERLALFIFDEARSRSEAIVAVEAFAQEIRRDALAEMIERLEKYASNLATESDVFMVNRCIREVRTLAAGGSEK